MKNSWASERERKTVFRLFKTFSQWKKRWWKGALNENLPSGEIKWKILIRQTKLISLIEDGFKWNQFQELLHIFALVKQNGGNYVAFV